MEHDMEWKGKYKSEILMVCHMDAMADFEVGAISEAEMREYDRDCLVQEPEETYHAEVSTEMEHRPMEHRKPPLALSLGN